MSARSLLREIAFGHWPCVFSVFQKIYHGNVFAFLFVSGSETGLGGHCSSLVARFFVCLFFALLVSLLLRGGTGYYLASHLVASSSG